MPRHDQHDLERRLSRDIEREPSYGKRQRIPLVETGAVKTWWAQRQQIAKVKP